MKVYGLAYPAYFVLRKVLTTTGLFRPFRRLLGPFGGRLLSRIASNGDRPSVVQGHVMLLASPGKYPPMALAMDRYEEGTTRLLRQIIKPGMAVIDAGAHVGYYTLLAARQVGPTGRVYAFEPEPANYDLLLRNIQRNEYTNIVAVNAALSRGVGQATLYLTGLDNGRHSLFRHGLPQQGSVIVEITTLDAFLESEGGTRVDLVKVDVEGSEADVLKGMEQLLRKPGELKLILEFNPALLRSVGLDPLQFLNRPADWGFNVHWIDEKKGPMPLESVDRVAKVGKLLNSETSVNLYCSRP